MLPLLFCFLHFWRLYLVPRLALAAERENNQIEKELNELKEKERHFSLTPNEFELINPNTRTCPVLRSQKEAEILLDIHKRIPILVPEGEFEKSRADFLIMFLSTLVPISPFDKGGLRGFYLFDF